MKALPGRLLGKCLPLALALGTVASCDLSLFGMPTRKELHFEQRLFRRYLEITVRLTPQCGKSGWLPVAHRPSDA